MTENGLIKALREYLEQAVADFRLPVKNGEPRAPRIYNGYLPPKRSGQGDDFPFVLVRPDAGETDGEETEVTISIVVGCYTEEFDGHEICLNIMQRIRHALFTLENGILANKYVLHTPFKWRNYEDQPYPLWQLDIETKWVFNSPQPRVNFIDLRNEIL